MIKNPKIKTKKIVTDNSAIAIKVLTKKFSSSFIIVQVPKDGDFVGMGITADDYP